MREFSTSITNALTNGLKPNESFRDTMFMQDLYNLIPSEMSCRSFEALIDVMPIDQDERHFYYPFPQWFRLEGDNILLLNDGVYEVIEFPHPPFDLKSVVLDAPDFTENFRSVDYGENWILTNRDGSIFKLNGEVQFSDKLKAAAITEHKNRTVIGGPLEGLWSDEFLAQLDNITGLADIEGTFNLDLGKNFIFWSGFDSNYFPFALIEPNIVFNDFTNSQAFVDLLYSNSFGYMEMPFKGAVLDMLVSNDQLFVFGEDGICSLAMNPQATGATYQITGQQSFGIKQRGAVGGDENSFAFIDRFNQLWYVSEEGLRKLDFSDYMEKLTGTIYITKDPDEEFFYIGDENYSFLLNGRRLTRIYQTVQHASGAYPFRGGVIFETGDKKARFSTDWLDIGNTDNKTLTGVAIGMDRQASGYAKAYAQVKGKLVESPIVKLNPEGYAATRIYGSQHGVEAVIDNYENLNIDHVELKWQIDDKRQRRGTFTTQDSSGAG